MIKNKRTLMESKNLVERENPENKRINQKFKDVLTGESRALNQFKKMGYDVEYDDSARKEFGSRYFGDRVTIRNPKTGNARNRISDIRNKLAARNQNESLNENLDGWDKVSDLEDWEIIKADMNSYVYEIDNAVRGVYTYAHTYSELADKFRELADNLNYFASLVEQLEDDEELDESLNSLKENKEFEDIISLQTNRILDMDDKAHIEVDPAFGEAERYMKKTGKVRDDMINKAIKDVKSKQGPVNLNPKRTEAQKKMHLSESLFEEWD